MFTWLFLTVIHFDQNTSIIVMYKVLCLFVGCMWIVKCGILLLRAFQCCYTMRLALFLNSCVGHVISEVAIYVIRLVHSTKGIYGQGARERVTHVPRQC